MGSKYQLLHQGSSALVESSALVFLELSRGEFPLLLSHAVGRRSPAFLSLSVLLLLGWRNILNIFSVVFQREK
jgi:hypothetical protein